MTSKIYKQSESSNEDIREGYNQVNPRLRKSNFLVLANISVIVSVSIILIFLTVSISDNVFDTGSIVQDFPIRKKPVYLHVKRRRWLLKSENKIVSRDWKTVAKGTRYTEEFASFLKGLFGYLPDKL